MFTISILVSMPSVLGKYLHSLSNTILTLCGTGKAEIFSARGRSRHFSPELSRIHLVSSIELCFLICHLIRGSLLYIRHGSESILNVGVWVRTIKFPDTKNPLDLQFKMSVSSAVCVWCCLFWFWLLFQIPHFLSNFF